MPRNTLPSPRRSIRSGARPTDSASSSKSLSSASSTSDALETSVPPRPTDGVKKTHERALSVHEEFQAIAARASRERSDADGDKPQKRETRSGRNNCNSLGHNSPASIHHPPLLQNAANGSKDENRGSGSSRGGSEDPVSVVRRSVRKNQDGGNLKVEDGDDTRMDDEIVEDEETTRCVCGLLDYPGVPIPEASARKSQQPIPQQTPQPSGPAAESQDEPGSLFIQCDTCEVWQHGGCVGIMTEQATPENYFCEKCRPDYHRVGKTIHGYVVNLLGPVEDEA